MRNNDGQVISQASKGELISIRTSERLHRGDKLFRLDRTEQKTF